MIPLSDKKNLGDITTTWKVALYYKLSYMAGMNHIALYTTDYNLKASSEGDVPILTDYDKKFPIIINEPSIRTSIDLAKSSAKVSDVTIKCINEYNPKSYLSDELYSATHLYFNQKVEIYRIFSINDSDVSDSGDQHTLIYTGRLVDVSHDFETCTIKVQSARPYDFLEAPTNKTNDEKNYIPIAYGNYSNSGSSSWGTDGSLATVPADLDKKVRPVPVIDPNINTGVGSGNSSSDDEGDELTIPDIKQFTAIVSDEATTGNVHLYDESIDAFLPLYDVTQTAVNNTDVGAYTINFPMERKRVYKVRPTGDVGETNESNANFTTNPSNAYDGSDSTYAQEVVAVAPNNLKWLKHYFDLPAPKGRVNICLAKVKMSITRSCSGSGCVAYGHGFKVFIQTSTGTGTKNWPVSGSGDNWEDGQIIDQTLAVSFNNDNQVSRLAVMVYMYSGLPAGYTTTFTIKLHDIVLYHYRIAGKDLNNAEHLKDLIDMPDKVYTGADGFKKSGNVTSGWSNSDVIESIGDAHRDILNRYAGFEIENNTDVVASNFYGVSDGFITHERDDWKIRFWNLKPKSIKSLIDKLQYEGGFIFMLNPKDQKHKYIVLKEVINSADVNFTTDDIEDIKISHSPFTELITKMSIQYDRHPAKDSYQKTNVYYDNSVRDKFNIQAKENIKEVKLDALVTTGLPDTDSDGNNSFIGQFWDHYKRIFGDIKIIISAKVVNPEKFGLEVGDIISFTNLGIKALNTELTSTKYFIITKLTTKINSETFSAREIV